MAAGLPVIATDVGAIGEVVRDGETGILVPPGDIRALASALDTLANDPARRRAMGARGQIFAERNFDGGANTKRILDVMTRISDTRRHHREASVAVRAI